MADDQIVNKMTTSADYVPNQNVQALGGSSSISRARQKEIDLQNRLKSAQDLINSLSQKEAEWQTKTLEGMTKEIVGYKFNPYTMKADIPVYNTDKALEGSPYRNQIAEQQKLISDLNLQASGRNADGSPIAPDFQSILNDDGTLPELYQLHPELLDPNTLQGYSMLREIATQQGPSKWADAANQQTEFNRQNTIDSAVRQSGAAAAQARSELGARGGSSAGMRERLAMNAGDNLMASKQGAYRTQSGQLLDVMKQDEQMKRDALTKFGEAEGKIALNNNALSNKANEYNLNNILKEEDLRRSYTMDNYKAALDKWGAIKQAEATRGGGGGGGK